MDMGLEGKVVLVTGAAGGIGSAVVRALETEGASSFATDLPDAMGDFVEQGFDLTRPEAAQACIDAVNRRFGRLDAMIHCAGISRPSRLAGTTDVEWDKVMDVNLSALFRLCRAAEPKLKETTGSIASIASFAGKRGTLFGDNASYTTSKAGVIGLTHALALEWAPFGIRANAVAPGPVDSPMLRELPPEKRDRLLGLIPLGRLPTAQDIADALVFLVSARANSITGEIMDVNGGLYLD